MKTFERLRKRLKEQIPDLKIHDDDCFKRYRPGRHMRAKGAFVWGCFNSNGVEKFGSCESATALLKAKSLGKVCDEICSKD